MSESRPIGFAGLSHLGIIYSIAASVRGFSVLAFDDRTGLADHLAEGRFPVTEPGLADAFQGNRGQIRYTADATSLSECELIFVTLDVTTDESNTSDLRSLETLIGKVSANAGPGTVVVLMSQVPPGYCRELMSRLPSNLLFFYQVETLIFGNALERAIRPERHIVGCAEASSRLPEIYRRYLEAFECPALLMRYESAELCKIAINCFLISSVTTTNALAEICEKVRADWREIVPALQLDRRIGPHAYLSPGLGIAGGNLERDLVTVQRLGAENGCDTGVISAWQQNSRYRKDWVLRLLHRCGLLNPSRAVQLGIWGIAYKPGTHSTKNSPSVELLCALRMSSLLAYDPAASLNQEDFPHVRLCKSALEAAQTVDALVIMTPWEEFSQVSLATLQKIMRGRRLIDPYGAIDGESARSLGFDYFRLGA